MLRIVLKDGRCTELVNGVCVGLEAIEADVACRDGRTHLLGHYTVAELRGYMVAPIVEADGDAAPSGPAGGLEPVFDLD